MQTKSSSSSSLNASELIQNLTAGLTVSFVAISLGAAFGILSGRGAFAGILSAGVIAFITSLFGGTRIQCSGPTGPMTAVTVHETGNHRPGNQHDKPAQTQQGCQSHDHAGQHKNQINESIRIFEDRDGVRRKVQF